jgi:hypothetical protein
MWELILQYPGHSIFADTSLVLLEVISETRPPLHIDECWSPIKGKFHSKSSFISHIYFI